MDFGLNKLIKKLYVIKQNRLYEKKFILHNKTYLKKISTNKKNKKKVLVEFNSFTSNHVIISNLVNFYSKKHNAESVAFFNYSLTSSPAFFSIKRNIKWYLGIFFSLRFFKIYKSFNVRKFVKPQINKSIKNETKVIFNKIIQNLKTNEDILKIKIRDIHVGDLILDGYMYYKKVPRVDVSNKDFKNYLNDFISIFLFWKKYLENNNVKALIGVHATYAYGIIHRIAISKDIDVILNIGGKVHRLSKKNKYQNSEFKSFKEIYKNFSTDDKIKAIEISKYFLDNRFLGQTSTEINEYRITTSPFSLPYNNKKSVLNKNEKLKVIIFPHELNDCSNGQGINFFPDYVSWLEKIVEISKSTNFDWYAKNHPQFKGKFEKYQPYSHKLAESIFAKNPNIKILPSETSHHQIIGEGIDFGLTVNGDVAYEYAYFGVPILTATNNCNTSCYDFNIHSNNKEEYLNKIKNLDMLKKKKIDRNSVLECYFMMDIYNGELSLLENYFDFLKNDKKKLYYDTYFSRGIYNELTKNWTFNKQIKLEETIKNFDDSGEYILTCNHSNKSIKELIRTYHKG